MSDIYGLNDPNDAEFRLAFLRFLKSATNGRADLASIQKRVPVQFLALRNAHGDYGDRELQSAFLKYRPVVLFPYDGQSFTVRVSFSGQLPETTARVILRGQRASGASRIKKPSQPGMVTIESSGSKGFDDQDHFVIEVVNDQDVLLAIGVPTIDHDPISTETPSTVATAQGD